MAKPMVRIHDLATDQILDREMTDQEFEQFEFQQIGWAKIQAEDKAKATARQAVLDRLGLTADEAKLLLG